MKSSFWKYLKKKWQYLVVVIIGFLFCFVLCNFINQGRAYYTASFEVENIELFEDEKLIDASFLNEIKENGSNDKYKNIDVDKMLSKEHFSYAIDGNKIEITTKVKYYDTFFLSKSKSLGTRAKMFIKDSVLTIAGEDNKITFDDPKNIISVHNYFNKWIFSLIGTAIIAFFEFIVWLILKLTHKNIEIAEEEYDNIEMFSSCFHKEYWKKALKPLTKVKDITTIAMLFALMLICKLISLPSGFGTLGISLTYLFFATIALIYGPVYGFVVGLFSDIIGYFIDSNGVMFNFGYTLQAALTGFIYGLCFYRRRVTFSNAFMSRVLVNFLMNVVLGSFLFIFVMYYDPSMKFSDYMELVGSYISLISLPKNVLYLLPQTLLLFFVLKATSPVLYQFNLIPKAAIIKHK